MEKSSDYESHNDERFGKPRSRRETLRTELVAVHKVYRAFAELVVGHKNDVTSGMIWTANFPKT